MWGSAIQGLSTTSLRALRVAAARSAGPLQPGASLGFMLLFSSQWGSDPLVHTTVSAVQCVASVWWHKTVSREVLQSGLSSSIAGWRPLRLDSFDRSVLLDRWVATTEANVNMG